MGLSLNPFDEARARAVAWLTAWDSQGAHRTATSGDEAGAIWLAREVAGFGVEVSAEVFELDRLDPVACYLQLDGERISAVPAFDAPATGVNGVTGTLSLSGHDEAIVVAKLTPRSVYTGEYERLRRDTARRALVIVCTGERRGMGLLNAERFRNPYGAPTIHVSSEASDTVLAGAGRAAPAPGFLCFLLGQNMGQHPFVPSPKMAKNLVFFDRPKEPRDRTLLPPAGTPLRT
jgi:hypothetical protein